MKDFHKNYSISSPIEVYEYTGFLRKQCQDGWAKWCDNVEVKNGVCKTIVADIEYEFGISDVWCIDVKEGETQDENL